MTIDQNKKLLEEISTLLARIAELEARGGKPPKTPTNSTLPLAYHRAEIEKWWPMIKATNIKVPYSKLAGRQRLRGAHSLIGSTTIGILVGDANFSA